MSYKTKGVGVGNGHKIMTSGIYSMLDMLLFLELLSRAAQESSLAVELILWVHNCLYSYIGEV